MDTGTNNKQILWPWANSSMKNVTGCHREADNSLIVWYFVHQRLWFKFLVSSNIYAWFMSIKSPDLILVFVHSLCPTGKQQYWLFVQRPKISCLLDRDLKRPCKLWVSLRSKGRNTDLLTVPENLTSLSLFKCPLKAFKKLSIFNNQLFRHIFLTSLFSSILIFVTDAWWLYPTVCSMLS